MAQQTTADEIAALERVRAEIELALSSNADWLAFRRGGTGRQLAELALAGNPLYRSWDLLNGAIRDLQAEGARQRGADPRVRDAARNVKLADVLESIRNDTALRGTELPSVVLDGQQPTPLLGQEQPPAARNSAPGPDSVARVVFEPEEATVTFVIREPVEPVPDLARERDAQLGPRSPDSAASAAASLAGPPDSDAGEAEVVIVADPANRASRTRSARR